MSANELRDAAQKLRDYAARTYTGPWSVSEEGLILSHRLASDGFDGDSTTNVTDDWIEGDTADRIALMHPGVGLALADWLDLTAATPAFDAFEQGRSSSHVGKNVRAAVQLARLINGGMA